MLKNARFRASLPDRRQRQPEIGAGISASAREIFPARRRSSNELRRDSMQPGPVGEGSRAELAFMVEGEDAVRAHYEEWRAMGLPIAQELTKMDFGPTFVALDPDGHRLRVCLYDN